MLRPRLLLPSASAAAAGARRAAALATTTTSRGGLMSTPSSRRALSSFPSSSSPLLRLRLRQPLPSVVVKRLPPHGAPHQLLPARSVVSNHGPNPRLRGKFYGHALKK